MSSSPEGHPDHTEAIPPEGTMDYRPPSPHPATDAADQTGAWQAEREQTDGTVDLPSTPASRGVAESGDAGTVALQPEAGQANRDLGGDTSSFLPGEDAPGPATSPPAQGPPAATSRLAQSPGTQRGRQGVTGGFAPEGAPKAPGLQSGRYLPTQFHARGGMGEIWLADDCSVGRKVALKKMRGRPSAEQKDEFLREAQITGQLEHPGVIPVHELGEDENGQPFYVMKFVKGRTLSDLIKDYHAPAQPGGVSREVQGVRLLQAFLNLCQTVAFAHAQGIIHRDLKPDNVMVGAYGETLLLDWGLAKPVGQADTPGAVGYVRQTYSGESLNTLDGAIKGTPSYMSPEVAEGRVADVDANSDIYLLGGTLYHILTGRKPREATKVSEFLRLAREQPPAPPRSIDRTIPKALDAICCKAMAHRKEDRYTGALELAEDLQRYLAGEPVSAYRENLWERAGRWVKRHRVALGRAAAVLAVAALVLFGLNELREAEERREAERIANELRLKQVEEGRLKAEREADLGRKREQAGRDIVRFRGLADEVSRLFAWQDARSEHFLSPGSEQIDRKADEARAALAAWGTDLAELPLEGEAAALKQQLYEVLLLQAEARSARGTRAEAARDTLAILDRAAALRPPTSGLLRLRAECKLLTDNGATRAAPSAPNPPQEEGAAPATALDIYLTAERLRAAHARATEEREKHTWTPDQQKLIDRAIEEYRKAINKNYNSFWAHFQLGQCYLALGKEDLALNALDTCVALRPDSPWGYTLRGHVRAALRRFDDARADLETAMKLAPQLREPRLQRGVVNWLQKRYDDALTDFDAALAPPAEQRLLEALFYRGQLWLELAKAAELLAEKMKLTDKAQAEKARAEQAALTDKAQADFSEVIARKPHGHPASLRRARIHFARGAVKLGMADLNAFLKRGSAFDPDSPEVCAERGRKLRLMLGELPREVKKDHLLLAQKELDRAIDLGAKTAAVYLELGAVLELLGKSPEAVRAYTEAVQLAPKEVRPLLKRGWVYEALSQNDAALADFATALRLEPTNAEGHAGLGYMHATRGGKFAAAASLHASEAVLHGGGDYLILHNVACVYGKLSGLDPAREREFQDLALVYLRREVEVWRRQRSGPDPAALIRAESAFPPALRARPEFQQLIQGGS